ncbi:Glycosyl transferase, family II [Desulfonema limicola]|uniref:Glycosyl transferase, family II n=1 Tax=Desulfonema limicola TaxID=45656 RepID=A0A975B5L7_9BACT|nr:glycosyltransferase family 2 protein [Desulfonema limicola]QTA79236.1 Glycosyl transferase, family II [Desulfonema limicola]
MYKFSIITAVRNGEKTLHDCFRSILSQNYLPEHIIIDGASTDNTLQIIKKHQLKGFRYISEPDKGIYDAMNKGIKLADGDIIGILNADDFYANQDVLSKIARVFKNPDIDSCYGDLIYVDPDNTDRVIRCWRSGTFMPKRFYYGWMPPHPTFFVRRKIYEKYGLFNLSLGSAADYELMLRFLLKHKITTAYIPEVLVKMRIGGVSNASLKNRIKANQMDRMAWKVNGLKPWPWTLWAKPLRKISQFMT